MKLYYAETTNSYKTCALARLLEIGVTFQKVDLAKGEQRSEAFLAINPNAKAPALTDGAASIWESNAILCYLAMKARSPLWPGDERQIDIIRWFGWSSEHFCRFAGQLYFEHVVRETYGLGEPDAQAVEEALGYFRKYAAILEAHLHSRKYLLGDDLSVADFATATVLPYAARAKLPLDEFSAVRKWHDRLMEMPAWRDPFPA